MMEYRIFSHAYQDLLARLINDLIEDGWELWGSPSVAFDKDGNEIWIQAMVKKTCS